MLSSAISNKIVSNKVLFILIGAAAAIFLTIYMLYVPTFNISKIVPGLTFTAVLNGLRRVREVWKTTRNVRKALKVAFGWSVISLIISVAGERTIEMLLENNNIEFLAKW
ncbi:hypothetical protein B7C51_11420 [Paenibacillus larvae subsp. pulvifaciens]|uniref:Uncharacterized protein n=1 Tax=Paenibacillus larvae subsp. pulvifaciens TaxID=1477 RepID=A0A1V0USQ9_9BACL|nr:hypothetical protein [Paenibacillus larvae]ARF68289.1 hypothetical protein B7C51_11420 [Paenibacillus larvae subsp. pulvifaciens]